MAKIQVLSPVVVICAVSLLTICTGKSILIRRSISDKSAGLEDAERRVCINKTPCGWAVYVPRTKRLDYFMKNSCDCPANLTCGRTNDDLSISAYVYRCIEASAFPNDPYAIPPSKQT